MPHGELVAAAGGAGSKGGSKAVIPGVCVPPAGGAMNDAPTLGIKAAGFLLNGPW